jgi:hypothetical protein
MLLRYSGVDKDEEEYADNEESKTEEVENLSESTEEVKEVTDFILGQGIPPVKDFPFLNRFKIPIENDDNVRDGLVNDMLKFCSDQSQSIEFRSRANNRSRLMLTIPKGKSQSTLRNLNVTVGRAIDWTSSHGTDNGAVAKSLISWLCSEYEDEFLEVATEQGLSTTLILVLSVN